MIEKEILKRQRKEKELVVLKQSCGQRGLGEEEDGGYLFLEESIRDFGF